MIDQYEELKALLSDYYTKLRILIKQTKTKDEMLAKLVGDAERHKRDFAFTCYKPGIMGLITFRETFHKELQDTFTFDYPREKVKKHIQLMLEDYSDVLSSDGVALDEWNGMEPAISYVSLANMYETAQNLLIKNQMSYEAAEHVADDEAPLFSEEPFALDDVRQLLNTFANKIIDLYGQQEKQDEVIKKLVESCASSEIYLINRLLYAFRKRLVRLNATIADWVSEYLKNLDSEMYLELYRHYLQSVLNESEAILIEAGVAIESAVLDYSYDPKKHRVLKLKEVNSSDGFFEGQIAKRYTDCYIYNEQIIYQAKADVYKIKKSN